MEIVRIKPSDGGDLITTESEASVDINNYTIKRNLRRVALKDEGRREGDVLFRPNIDVDAEAQYNLPNTGGEEITLIETARHPDGTVALIVGTPTRLYRFSEITSGVEVHFGAPYSGASGDDALADSYPIYGVKIKTVTSSPKKITVYGDWHYDALVGEKIVVTNSGAPKGFDVTAVTMVSSGVSGTYFGAISGVTQPSDDLVFTVSVDPTTDLSVGDTFTVSGTTSYNANYTVKSLTSTTVTVHEGAYVATETGFLYSEDGGNTVLTVDDGLYDEDLSGFYANVTAVSQPGSDLVFTVDQDPTVLVSPSDTITVAGTGDVNYDTTHTVLSTTATTITVSGGTFTATATGTVEKPDYDLITEIAAADYITGPESLLPVYSATEAGRWALINPKTRPSDPTSPDYLFSTDAHRWEMVNVGGTVVFNNGVDLPVAYDIQSLETNFVYELREAGYAFVGTIAEYNNMLLCMDIALIDSDAHKNLMNRSDEDGIFGEEGPYGRFTDETKVSRISYRLVSSPTNQVQRFGIGIPGGISSGSGVLDLDFGAYSFESGVELHIPEAGAAIGYSTWANGTSYGLGVTVEASGTLYISDNAGVSSGTSPSDDIGVSWTALGSSAYLDLVTTTVGVNTGTLTFLSGTAALGNYFECYVASTLARIEEGTDFSAGDSNTDVRDAMLSKLTGLGLTGYTFSSSGTDTIEITTTSDYWAGAYDLDDNSTIVMSHGGRYTLANTASNTVTEETVQRFENFELSPQPIFYDLGDNNSGILRAQELKGYLVVFKEDVIYVGAFTGLSDDPLSFEKVYTGKDSIFWRWCLSKVDGEYFVYPGKNRFYRFDVVSRTPTPMHKLGLCDNLFFDYSDADQLERTYSAVNSLSREVWFVIPEAPTDKILCWDYEYDTCSTIDKHYSAASTIDSIVEVIQFGPSTVLFVMGTSDGVLFTYGLSDVNRPQFVNGKQIYSREGVYEPDTQTWNGREEYDSIYQAGFGSITKEYNEAILKNVGVIYSSKATENPPLTLTLYGTLNPSRVKDLLFEVELTDMDVENTVQAYYVQNYYQDKGKIAGFDYAAFSSRVFGLDPVDSQSVTRDSDA